MDFEPWIRIAIELFGMAAVGFGFIFALKADTRILGQRLNIVDRRLDRVEEALGKIGEQKARLDVIDERLLSQGKRVDDNAARLTDWIKEVYEVRHEILENNIKRIGESNRPGFALRQD